MTYKIILCLSMLFLTFKSIGQELSIMPRAIGVNYYEDDRKLSFAEFERKLSFNKESFQLWRKHKKQKVGAAIFYAGSLVSIYWYSKQASKHRAIAPPLIAFFSSFMAYFGLLEASSKNRAEAVLNYNRNVKPKFEPKLGLQINQSGLSLVLNF